MRIVHLDFAARDGDGAALRAFLARAIPFYQAIPGIRIRLLSSTDRPGRFIEVVEYATSAAFEADERRMAGDPRMQALLGEWRGLIADLAVTSWEEETQTL